MKAWTYTARGTPSQVLKLRHDFPQPQPTDLKPGEVLIKVSHVALFAPHVKLMILLPHLNDNPWIPENEFSGTVVAVSDDRAPVATKSLNPQFQPSEPVFGMLDPRLGRKYNGVLAEYIIMPESAIVRRPTHVKPEEAAGFSGAGCTAIQFSELSGLLEIEQDPEGEGARIVSTGRGKRVLVTAGSSGTGATMVQLAKVLVGKEGCVVATCSERNARSVVELGADEVIDYTKHPQLHRHVIAQYSSNPFDVIIDIAGSDPHLFTKSAAYLKEDGIFIFAGNMPVTFSSSERTLTAGLVFIYQVISWLFWIWLNSVWPVALGGVPRRGTFHSGMIDGRTLQLVGQLVEEEKIRGVVDSVWGLEDALKGYERVSSGRARGKVVVSVQD